MVSEQVGPKEKHIFKHINTEGLTRRETLAVELSSRISLDPHLVDDAFFGELKGEFSEEELVELIFAASLYNFGNKFNITMRLDTDADSPYAHDLEYTPPQRG